MEPDPIVALTYSLNRLSIEALSWSVQKWCQGRPLQTIIRCWRILS